MTETLLICDRCGMHYTKNDTYKGTLYHYKARFSWLTKRDSKEKDRIKKLYHLCPCCAHALHDWLGKHHYRCFQEVGE